VKRLTAALAFLLLATVPAAAQTGEVSADDVAAADARRRQVGTELAEITAEYDANIGRAFELETDLDQLSASLSVAERDLATTRVAAEEVAREMYMSAGSLGAQNLFGLSSITEVPLRNGYLAVASSDGSAVLARLLALEDSYQEQNTRLGEALEAQEQANADLEDQAAVIMARLEEANAEYQTVAAAFQQQEEERRQREEEERLRQEEIARNATSTTTTLAPDPDPDPTTTTTTVAGDTTTTVPDVTTTTVPSDDPDPGAGGMACPVDGAVAFTDTWGAPRSGGRFHEGVDMIAVRGTPAVAVESGKVKRMGNGGLGGITVWLRGDSGDEYYYAHLDGWASGLAVGQHLSAGELLGYVGNTGNAAYTVTHLHFEFHPGGGSAVNPYPLAASLCL